MGQKTNSNLLRLNIRKNEWNSKYFEKNKEEFTVFNYQNIQIQHYLKEMFEKFGIILHDCKIQFNQNCLYIFVSYYVTKKSQFIINNSATSNKLKIKQQKLKQNTKVRQKNKNISKLNLSDFQVNSSNKRTQFKIKRLALINKYRKYSQMKTNYNNAVLNNKTFFQKILENLSVYTNYKYNIFLTTQNLNKGLTIKLDNKEVSVLKKKIFLFKRYTNQPFFKESFNILISSAKINNSGKLISEYIALQISLLKKHNYFLIFLKQLLEFIIKIKISHLKGIKIAIKGKFNNAPRAKTKIISIGNIPIQTLKKNINYHESTSYTKNGTFGIKVWVN